MANRRDQLHSYQFLLQRVISSLVMRETDPFQSPLRRGTGAIFAGTMIAVIVAAVFGVVGLLTKMGNQTWQVNGAIVVEQESGASFVYNHGKLNPMVNYASALLAGKGVQQVFRVPAESLTGVPRGTTKGIPGAPMSLPGSGDVVGAPWTLCSVPGHNAAGNATNNTVLVAGRSPAGGRRLSSDAILTQDAASSTVYLIWHDHKYQVNDPNTVVGALYGSDQSPAAVGSAWLNALPRGLDIGPITITNQGKESAAVPGMTNGDIVYATTGTSRQYYVVLDDGLARLTTVNLDILRAQTGEQPQSINVKDAIAATKSNQLARSGNEADPPSTPPHLAAISSSFDKSCATYQDDKPIPSIVVGGSFAGLGSGIQTTQQTSDGAPLADRILVPAGHVAVVRAMGSDTADVGAYNLVTDTGKRFAVPSASVLQQLGYTTSQAVSMPASLLNRVPAGPALSPSAAKKAAP